MTTFIEIDNFPLDFCVTEQRVKTPPSYPDYVAPVLTGPYPRLEFRSNEIYLLGDTHGTTTFWPVLEYDIPNGSNIVHLGDVGLGFGHIGIGSTQLNRVNGAREELMRLNDTATKNDLMVYLIRGNHDAPWVWTHPDLDLFHRIVRVQDGTIGVFPNGKKALMVGGGVSLDRITRAQDIDYWSDEPTPELTNLEKCDFLFTHDAPHQFNLDTKGLGSGPGQRFGWYVDRDPTLIPLCYEQRNRMYDIAYASGVKKIFGGHYHNSMIQRKDKIRYQALSENELLLFKAK
jgi:hypothetical protein